MRSTVVSVLDLAANGYRLDAGHYVRMAEQRHKERLDAYEAALQDWTARYPRYCLDCGGRGVVEISDDPSPAGVSLAPGRMVDFEACPSCLEEDVCPRCAHVGLSYDEDGYGACFECGWNQRDAEQGAVECAPEFD